MRPKIFLQLSFIIFIIILVWHKTLGQGLWGDGFYWFNPGLRNSASILPINLNHTYYNLLSRKIFDMAIPIFRDNMKLYLAIQIVFLIALTIAIYFVALKLTKKTVVAFATCIIFATNYGGMYEMMAEGNINRFLERVPNLILVIAGIYFLALFLEKKKIKHFFVSWVLFVTGIYLGQFASFVLPFYISYPIFYLFDNKKLLKSIFVGLAIAAIFTISNFLIIRNSDQRSGYTLSYYLNPEQRFIEKTFLMTTPLIVPQELVINIAKNFPGGALRNPYVSLVRFYTFALIFVGAIIAVVLFKKNKKLLRLYLSCIFTMLVGTALMIYTDPIKYDPFKNFQAGRQVFIQSIFYAIALSSILVYFLQKHKKTFVIGIALSLSIFVIYNTGLSWQQISQNQYIYKGNDEFISYIKTLFPNFNQDTVVVLGTKLEATNNFLNDFYGPPLVNFISAPEDIRKFATAKNKNNTYVIDVNYNPTPDGYYLPERVRIDDFTNLYRRSTNLDLVDTWGTKPVTWFETLNTQK